MTRLHHTRERVLHLLSALSPLPAHQVARGIQAPTQHARAILKELHRAGYVTDAHPTRGEKTNHQLKTYKLTRKGVDHVIHVMKETP